jgi:hypothetical protein
MEPRMMDKGFFTVVGAAQAGQLGEFSYGPTWQAAYGQWLPGPLTNLAPARSTSRWFKIPPCFFHSFIA